jgi:hypothetical protein
MIWQIDNFDISSQILAEKERHKTQLKDAGGQMCLRKCTPFRISKCLKSLKS